MEPTRADETVEKRNPNEMSETVQFWLDEIGASRKREKDFRKDGKRIREIYDGSKSEETPFNILFSNTETMAPALYSQVPRPVVQRRFKDADPLGKVAASAGQRMLEFMLDTNIDGYETFDDAMKSIVNDALLPGRGVSAVKYDATIGVVDGMEIKTAELVCCDSRSWDRVFFGFARKWSKVPWIAFEEHMDLDAAEEKFGKDIANKIEFTVGEDNDDEDGKEGNRTDERDTGERKTALVYQIWDKANGKVVRYISPHYKEGYLKIQDDPLELTGFFPIPRPLQFVEKSNDLKPVAPYILYENQAKELNRLTRRINRIAEAIKARGIYDSSLGGDIENVMKADDNTLVPSDKSSSLAAEKGMQNAIWFLPIQELVVTHEKLLMAREQCKQVIYEITGISDIIRGATKASETLGAQKLKSQWGTLRIKPKQGEVQRYARDVLRLMLEIAASKFSEDTWAQMTGLPFLTAVQVQQAQQIAQAAQLSGQPPPPEVVQQLKQPTWEAVLGMLRKDTQRAYRIDIETNSTVEPEAVEDQKNIADLMTALGQFLNGVGPLVEKGVMPFEVAQTMMLSITRRFRFGSEIEDQIKAMKPPPPPPQEDNGDAAKIADEKMKAQQAIQSAQAQVTALEQKLLAAQFENQAIAKKAELDLREAKVQVAEEQLRLKEQMSLEKINTRDQFGQEKLSNQQKVTSLMEAKSRDVKANASKSESKINGSINSLQSTAALVEQGRTEMLRVIEEQGRRTEYMVSEMLKALTSPRTKKVLRGKDGRISHVIEGPGEEQSEGTMQ